MIEFEDNVLDEYNFRNKSDRERAKREKDTIEKLKQTIDTTSVAELKQLYLKMTNKSYFVTPVGINFLRDLRKYLNEQGLEDLPYIPIVVQKKKDVEAINRYKDKLEKKQSELDAMRLLKNKCLVAIAALILTIIGMTILVMTNDNLGYDKAKEKVTDEYSAWEEQLREWEDDLIEREDAISQKEKGD